MSNCKISDYAKDRWGYPLIKFAGKTTLQHRQVYAASNNLTLADITGKAVMHTCDNPGCINPDHLVLGTQADNVADMVTKQRQARGATHPKAKLTEAQVLEIRRKYKLGARNGDLAKEYELGTGTISSICTRRIWEHL